MGAEYIKVAVANVISVLAKYLPPLLAEEDLPMFTSIGKVCRFMLPNPPQAWVMPVRTNLDPEGQFESEAHTLTIRMGLAGASEPDNLYDLAVTYATAVTRAIRAATADEW